MINVDEQMVAQAEPPKVVKPAAGKKKSAGKKPGAAAPEPAKPSLSSGKGGGLLGGKGGGLGGKRGL